MLRDFRTHRYNNRFTCDFRNSFVTLFGLDATGNPTTRVRDRVSKLTEPAEYVVNFLPETHNGERNFNVKMSNDGNG